MSEALVVDLFAGGGGTSCGLTAAGLHVDIAINHDPVALAVHRANHPETEHLETDVWDVKPIEATRGRPVGVLWASPDCTHFSVAKGGKPKKQNIRSLAWVVVRWAKDVRPAVIFLENVQEFRGWGPLGLDGMPIKARMGETFQRWRRQLERLGYVVDHRVLDASLYGAPTKRRRLFLVARCDGLPITWPAPTHGPGRLPLHTAAECIDWSLPCPSIFERKRPLADKTLWRIAQGIRRFVLENPRPFIVGTGGPERAGGPADSAEPLGTIMQRSHRALVTPVLATIDQQGSGDRASSSPDVPLPTTTTKNRHAVIAPVVVKVNHGDDAKTGARIHSVEQPLTTVTATSRGHALVAPTLIQTSYGERKGQRPRYLDLHEPLGTVVAQGQKHALVAAFISKHYGGVVGQQLSLPIGTITAKDHHALSVACLAKFRGTGPDQPGSGSVEEPLPTISAGGIHVAQVRAFLTAYYGEDGTSGQQVIEPLRTITARHRLGLVTVEGTDYQIVDIGMRMLAPHELLRAQFGRFAAGYDLSAAKTQRDQVRLIGNSVCPEVAEAIVAANLPRGVRKAA